MKPFKKTTQPNIKLPKPEIANRVPPGQFAADKFPVLSYGPTPRVDLKSWDFKLFGLVEQPVALNYQQFMGLPKVLITADFHCVTQWTRLNNTWEGVSIHEVMKLVKVRPEAKFVMIYGDGDYSTNLPLQVILDDDVLFAYKHDGRELEPDHGWPLRLVVPKRYGWKSAKWVRSLEFMAEDRPGFWEMNGYSMSAKPWEEDRFS